MKHTLEEKYTLVEKYILTEETLSDTPYDQIDIPKFVETIANVKELATKVLDKAKKNSALAELISKLAPVSASYADTAKGATIATLPAIQSKIKDYLQIIATSPLKDKFNESNRLKNMIQTLTDDSKAAIPTDTAAAQKLLADLTGNFTKLNKTLTVGDKVARFVASVEEQNFYGLADKAAEAEEALPKLKNYAMNHDLALNVIQAIKDFVSNCEPININPDVESLSELDVNTLVEQLTTIINFINELTADEPVTDEEKNSDDKQQYWSTIFKKAKSTQELTKIYARYLTVEWGKDAEKVKALGKGFVQELQVLGYTAKTNPFIAFLQTKVNGKTVINSFNIDALHYGVLHNTIAQTGAMDYLTDTDSIIYNRYLFTVSPTEMKEYMMFESFASNEHNSFVVTDERFLAHYKNNRPLFIWSAISASGDPLKLKDSLNSGPLAPLERVNEIKIKCFGGSKLKRKSTFNIDAIDFATKAEYENAIKYIISTYNTELSYPELVSKLPALNTITDKTLPIDYPNKYKQKINSFEINPSNVVSVLKALIEKGKIGA